MNEIGNRVEVSIIDTKPEKCTGVYDKKLIDTAKEYCNNDAGISDWTRWNDGVTVTDAVAYAWGCADSVEDFNADLEEQKNALSAYYADTNKEQLGENPPPSEHRDWSPWDQTVAPGTGNNRWHNYLFGRFDEEDKTYHYLTINGTRHNPYMPGLSTWKKFDQDNYYNYDTKRSAGVECVGFIQRCASYEGNPYAAIDINSRCIWGGGMPTLMYGELGFSRDEYSWLIEDRNLLIPGDVLLGNGHIVMVLRVNYVNNARDINLNLNGTTNNVYVIESTKGNLNQWKVMDENSWYDLGVGYELRRLRTVN
jgi:hypothetical protein